MNFKRINRILDSRIQDGTGLKLSKWNDSIAKKILKFTKEELDLSMKDSDLKKIKSIVASKDVKELNQFIQSHGIYESNITDAVTLTEEEFRAIQLAYDNSLEGPETSEGITTIRGIPFALVMNDEDFFEYSIIAHSDSDDLDNLVHTLGEFIYHTSTISDVVDREDVIPHLDEAVQLIADYLSKINETVPDYSDIVDGYDPSKDEAFNTTDNMSEQDIEDLAEGLVIQIGGEYYEGEDNIQDFGEIFGHNIKTELFPDGTPDITIDGVVHLSHEDVFDTERGGPFQRQLEFMLEGLNKGITGQELKDYINQPQS